LNGDVGGGEIVLVQVLGDSPGYAKLIGCIPGVTPQGLSVLARRISNKREN